MAPRRFLDRGLANRLDPADQRLVMQLAMAQPIDGEDVPLSGAVGLRLLRDMLASGRCHCPDAVPGPLRGDGPPRRGEPCWEPLPDGRQRTRIRVDGDPVRVLPLAPPHYLDPATGRVGRLEIELPPDLLVEWLALPDMDREDGMRFRERVARRFPGANVPLPLDIRLERLEGYEPTPELTFSLSREGSAGRGGPDSAWMVLLGRLTFNYRGRQVAADDPPVTLSVPEDDGSVLYRIQRHQDFERAAADRLRAIGLVRLDQTGRVGIPAGLRHCWTLDPAAEPTLADLVADGLPRLEKSGWKVSFTAGSRLRLAGEGDWYSRLQAAGPGLGSETGWTLEVGVQVEGRSINLIGLLRTLFHQLRRQDRQKAVAQLRGAPPLVNLSGEGVIVLPAERCLEMVQLLDDLLESAPADSGVVALDLMGVARVGELEALADVPWGLTPAARGLVENLRRGTTVGPLAESSRFGATLRPYQRVGVGWLEYLRTHEINGILADDMGLGKTVQVLAFLQLQKEAGRLGQPVLVVAPTSLLPNWRAECARLAPDLRVTVLHGADRRERLAEWAGYDLCLTSYPLLWRDEEAWRARRFSWVVLDEAQYIKNKDSRAAQVAGALTAERRLCLTGTPMENHLGELWSLFHFLAPGLLGDADTFRKVFRLPIERDGDVRQQDRLGRRVAPFLLRRTKEEVAPDLPPRTEIEHEVPLGDRQRALYERIRTAQLDHVRRAVAGVGWNRARITVLTALLRLRQVCCDPRLVEPDPAGWRMPADSAKLEAVLDLLDTLVAEGRRVLVFSQFVRMLDLIEPELTERGWSTARLTGSTRDRAEPVARFQRGETPVFLISLKAGGTGLNLTAADTVILYDPWWNPATERQAADRAHRIGQDRPVFVYKMLAAGSVESRILALQRNKQALVDGVLGARRAEGLAFGEADLEELLAPLAGEP